MTSPSSALALIILAAGRARRYGGVKPLAPVGPTGETPLDLVASDAVAAGFRTLVLVIGDATGGALRYHVERRWPKDLDVRFAVQQTPRGTVDAALSARALVDAEASFAVANADDIYGASALRLLGEHLASGKRDQALVGFRLQHAVVGDAPVTRGVCEVDADHVLVALEERREVVRVGDGTFVVKDGLVPGELDANALVSMNLWGFRPDMWQVLGAAMDRQRADAGAKEALLPEAVRDLLAAQDPSSATFRFRVLPTEERCLGVTHFDDVALVGRELAAQIANGQRPAELWERPG
jgi:NDP-sugar pyrophosphorylase family protein